MRSTEISLWVIFSICLSFSLKGQIPFDCSGQYYVTLSDELLESPSDLYEVVLDDGIVSFDNIKFNIGGNINAIGYRSTDNFIYGVDPDDHYLYLLDATGQVYYQKTLDLEEGLRYFAGDVTPDGKYLVLIGGTFFSDEAMSLVDLEDPEFNVTNIPLIGQDSRIYDIAFDPIEQTLYGFDSNSRSLVKIDINNGNLSGDFPAQSAIGSIGALFFDTFGNLYAYGGSSSSNTQDVLFQVNKVTGKLTFGAQGPFANGNDGCSCPYTVKVEKVVNPEITLPCTEVDYTFRIANYSGRAQSGLQLIDQLPEGFTINEILYNPYGGSSENTPDVLEIYDLTVHPGLDSIVVRVAIDELPPGLYYNQARLNNLPSQLGGYALSDDPSTLEPEDSTKLELIPLSLEFIEEEQSFCEGDTLIIDATLLGAEILWDDGTDTPIQSITEAGTYVVEAATNCNRIIKTIEVTSEFLDLTTDETFQTINLGEQIDLSINITNTGLSEDILWSDPLDNSLDCLDCVNVTAFPLFDVTYSVYGINEQGCEDEIELRLEVIKPRHLYAPNVFSPNQDGLNDYFFLFGNPNTKIVSLGIFDRWGSNVFRLEGGSLGDSNLGWDGRCQERALQPGVYTWIAEVEFLDGIRKVYTGDITLLR